ncbi:MAG: LysR family transcriptional regulator [Oxalobacteraceae bacterium]|jgi:DNA-binding transcriptional LysR family regulator|nr:MAG: LysR family transcriptional regulator [Oxalobacteraceae bacterium]
MAHTRITLRQLEAFAAVAELQSFSAASQRLALTPSAVSQLVSELESTLGFRVFDRSTRQVSLSSAGRDYLSSAQTVLRHVRLAESAASDVRNRAAGLVRIGAPQVLASAMLPKLVREFQAERPKVKIHIRDTAVDQLVEAVESADVDLAVGPDRPHGDGIRHEVAFDSPWVLWCHADHVLASQKAVSWKDLSQIHLVAAGRDHERSVAQMHLDAPHGAGLQPVDVVDNITTALGMAAEGLAVTLAPAYVGALARRFGLVYRRVLDPETIRQVCVYHSRTRSLPPAAEAFSEFLIEHLAATDS